MRFLFISSMGNSPWGGSEELWSQAAARLRSLGHDVASSVSWWPALVPQIATLESHGVKIRIRKALDHRSLPSRVWWRVAHRIHWKDEDAAWLRRSTPDLVIISQGANCDGQAWMELCVKAGLPFAVILQCNSESWWPNDRTAGPMAKAYLAARRVYCVSQHNLKLLEDQIGERLPNAVVVKNPFNVSTDEPPAWPNEDGAWKIACVGRLEPVAKGQDLLFHIFSKPQWRNRPVELNLYGKGSGEVTSRKLAATLGLQNVRFHGHVGDIRKVWEDNHILVLPSRYEGLPLALVEAMWCARPAVVTDIGGNAELCTDGVTGFVASAPSVQLVDDALERAWGARESWQSMGQAGRMRVESCIPKDPAACFADELISLCTEVGTRTQ
jgi:glycosyltransferase involved in cell wall biosynthesis